MVPIINYLMILDLNLHFNPNLNFTQIFLNRSPLILHHPKISLKLYLNPKLKSKFP